MSLRTFDGKKWYDNVEPDTVSHYNTIRIYLMKSLDLLNLGDNDQLSYFSYDDRTVKHLIVNITSMHIKSGGWSGFFSVYENIKTKILELKGT